ncbi:hypothetical protein KC19_5G031200, partial [Ceratodon purpureus]
VSLSQRPLETIATEPEAILYCCLHPVRTIREQPQCEEGDRHRHVRYVLTKPNLIYDFQKNARNMFFKNEIITSEGMGSYNTCNNVYPVQLQQSPRCLTLASASCKARMDLHSYPGLSAGEFNRKFKILDLKFIRERELAWRNLVI